MLSRTPRSHGVLFVFALALLAARPAVAQRHMQHSDISARSSSAPVLFQSDMSRMTGMVPVDPRGRAPGWQWMTMGVVRFDYNNQGGGRGVTAWESPNWFMGMTYHRLGPGRITFMLMNSLEPVTLDDPGSPQIFQTGGTLDDEPLVDFQHPHDFLMNISATYRAPLGTRGGAWAQYAPIGSPAMGPISYMHRASSGDNPAAPLGHHWQDASHVTDNVATVGVGWKRMSLEASGFHGREPDEDRWDIDWGKMDSYSGRARLGITRKWAIDASYGDLHEYHATIPGDVQRTTAAIQYGEGGNSPTAFMLLWGHNDGVHGPSNSFLAEFARQLAFRHQVYARFEWVEEDLELLLTREHIHAPGPRDLTDVSALTVGYFNRGTMFNGLGMGGDVTVYDVPSDLQSTYGDFPVSIHVFIRARWNIATADAHTH